MRAAADSPFSSWDNFVLRHQKPGNLIVHFISAIFYYVSPIVALLTWNPYWLLFFASSGILGAAGHYAFRDGGVSVKEATFSPLVPLFVLIMFYKIFTGTYGRDTELAERKLARLRLEAGIVNPAV
jgi:hypothetical protein